MALRRVPPINLLAHVPAADVNQARRVKDGKHVVGIVLITQVAVLVEACADQCRILAMDTSPIITQPHSFTGKDA